MRAPPWTRRPLPQWLVRLSAGALVVGALVGSVLPEMAPPETYNLDKVVHLGAYGVLALVLACLRGVGPLGAVLLATGLSGLAELTQLGSPWRHASLGDFLANALGAVLGVLVHRVLTRRFPALFRPSPPPGDAP